MVRQQCPICWKLLYNDSAGSLKAHQSCSRRCLKWQKHYEAEGRSPEPPPPRQSHREGRSPEPPPPPRQSHRAGRSPEHKRSSSRNRRRSRSRRDSRSRRRSRIPRGSDDGQRQRCSRHPRSWCASHKRSSSSRNRRRSRSRRDSRSRRRSRIVLSDPAEMFSASRLAADHTLSVPGDNIREMATGWGTLSCCPCKCRFADAIFEVPVGRKRCGCRMCEWTPECYRLAVQGEDKCKHCMWVIDPREVGNCGHPGIRLPGIAQARPSLLAVTSTWGSWWREDGTRLLCGMMRRLRGPTGRISDGQLPRTDSDVNMCDALACQLEPQHNPIKDSAFGRAIRAVRASRSCEPG
jgi:hypothetical protein